MAIFTPTLQEIQNNRMERPTAGEWTLLNKLRELPNDYEVYFQSHINLAHPDIVILKKGCGALIIEVKDWNLDAYEFHSDFDNNKFGVMTEKRGHSQIRNPFEQAYLYKEELFNLYSSALYVNRITNKATYGVVKDAVYFSNATEQEVEMKFGKENFKNKKFLDYHYYWANNSSNLLANIEYMLRKNSLFTDEIYDQIKLVLTPSSEWREQAESFELSKEQDRFAISEEGKRQKIKGVPGSGKTLVLAKRAVNCYKRIHEPVLILTFNITLPHYIRDKISQITRDLTSQDKKQFHIKPIHDFVKDMLNNYSIYYKTEPQDPCELLRDRLSTLKAAKNRITYKYKAILIDEVQDFEYDWLKDIEELFLAENGELVLFGDEKQNIYNRSVDENKLPRTRINGRWSQLKESYRLTKETSQLAEHFQKQFFKDKYETTNVEYVQETIFNYLARKEMRYYEISPKDQNYQTVHNIIQSFRQDGTPIAANDICILSDNCETLRNLDYHFRTQSNIKFARTCETKEQYDALAKVYEKMNLSKKELNKKLKRKLHSLRKIQKIAFRMNPGTMKLSTIHSFKGWEINTVVLLLDNQFETNLQDELIYTAITRAKKNLVIINLGNTRYHNFFKNEMPTYHYNSQTS